MKERSKKAILALKWYFMVASAALVSIAFYECSQRSFFTPISAIIGVLLIGIALLVLISITRNTREVVKFMRWADVIETGFVVFYFLRSGNSPIIVFGFIEGGSLLENGAILIALLPALAILAYFINRADMVAEASSLAVSAKNNTQPSTHMSERVAEPTKSSRGSNLRLEFAERLLYLSTDEELIDLCREVLTSNGHPEQAEASEIAKPELEDGDPIHHFRQYVVAGCIILNFVVQFVCYQATKTSSISIWNGAFYQAIETLSSISLMLVYFFIGVDETWGPVLALIKRVVSRGENAKAR